MGFAFQCGRKHFKNGAFRKHEVTIIIIPVQFYSNTNRKEPLTVAFLNLENNDEKDDHLMRFIFQILRRCADPALHVIHCFIFSPSLPFALLFGMLLFFSQTMKKFDSILSVSYYRSEEREFENFMRAFFGQFQPDRERFQGASKPQKRRRKKKH